MAQEHEKLVRTILPGDMFFFYHPALTHILDSVNEAILIGYLLYWHGKGWKRGITFKTESDMRLETGLSSNQQRTAIKRSTARGFLKVTRKGIPQKRHFELDIDVLINYITSHEKNTELILHFSKNSTHENQRTITESNKELNKEINTIYRVYLRANGKSKTDCMLTPKRQTLIAERLSELGYHRVHAAVVNCAASSLYNGEGDGIFKGSIEYIFKSYENTENLSNMGRGL